MFLTGFADEAGTSLDVQIAATKELGWNYIETRAIGTKNLASLSEAEFEEVCGKLSDAGISISCFGSGVANWAKHPRKEEDFEASKTELLNAIPRMHKLGIKLIRGMSFLTPADEEPDSPELEKIIFTKLRELVRICADNGIVYGHENCMNYGGLSYQHTLKLIDAVNSPESFKLIFDTGNPVCNYRRIGQPPYPIQSSWEFYQNVKEFITYIHIKDALAIPGTGNVRPDAIFTFPGFGGGDVRAIVCDLLKNGYNGGISIEPHVAAVFHDTGKENASAAYEKLKYDSYVRYGKIFMKLLEECKEENEWIAQNME